MYSGFLPFQKKKKKGKCNILYLESLPPLFEYGSS